MTAGVMRNAHHPLMMETCAYEVRDDVSDVEVEGENVDLCSLMSSLAVRPIDRSTALGGAC